MSRSSNFQMDAFKGFLDKRVSSEGTLKQYVSALNVLDIPLLKLKVMSDDQLLQVLNKKITEKVKFEGKTVMNRSYCRKPAYRFLLHYLGRQHLVDLLSRIPFQPRRRARKDVAFSVVKGMVGRAKRPDYKLMIMILSDTGCRISALMTARVRDIAFDGSRAVLTLTEKKTGTITTKYLSRSCSRFLKSYIKGMGDKAFLLPFRSEERARHIIKEIGPDISPHWFRHSKAIAMLRSEKFTLVDVGEQLDHRSLESTRKYLKAAGTSSKKVMELMEPEWDSEKEKKRENVKNQEVK